MECAIETRLREHEPVLQIHSRIDGCIQQRVRAQALDARETDATGRCDRLGMLLLPIDEHLAELVVFADPSVEGAAVVEEKRLDSIDRSSNGVDALG